MAENVGRQFLQFYYDCYDKNRAQLSNLLTAESMLTFAGENHRSAQAILNKINQLPKTTHNITSSAFQPLPAVEGGLLVFVTGSILLEGEANPLPFSEIFTLIPQNNSYVIGNNIFNLATI